MRKALIAGPAALAGLFLLAAPAAAMPGAGVAAAAGAERAGLVEQVEFRRRPDGSVYWVRPNPNGEKTYYFAYRGYAYPYNPGYAYREARGELRPSDRLRRYRIAE
jgi:hypothetical protein